MESDNLGQILKKDKGSRQFFQSLSPELQTELLKNDVNNFRLLKSSAENCSKTNQQDISDTNINPACSSTECTGLIPNGDNQDMEDIKIYKDIFPFGSP